MDDLRRRSIRNIFMFAHYLTFRDCWKNNHPLFPLRFLCFLRCNTGECLGSPADVLLLHNKIKYSSGDIRIISPKSSIKIISDKLIFFINPLRGFNLLFGYCLQ